MASTAIPYSERLPEVKWAKLVFHAILVVLAFVMFYPFIWMILASFKDTSEIVSLPPTFLPQNFTTVGYQEIFDRMAVARSFLNSLIVSGVATFFVGLTSSLAGYVLAKYRFPGRNIIFVLLISQMMLPIAVTILPLYTLFTQLGLENTYTALIAPFAMNGFGIFLMRQFMFGLPDEIFEAARIDGATDWLMYWKIALPLTLSPLAGVTVFTFLLTWNQFWWPLVIVSSPDMRTVTQAVAMASTSLGRRLDILAAGATIAVLPIIIVFAVAMRQVVASIAFGGSKE